VSDGWLASIGMVLSGLWRTAEIRHHWFLFTVPVGPWGDRKHPRTVLAKILKPSTSWMQVINVTPQV